jgi:hypothetical protein
VQPNPAARSKIGSLNWTLRPGAAARMLGLAVPVAVAAGVPGVSVADGVAVTVDVGVGLGVAVTSSKSRPLTPPFGSTWLLIRLVQTTWKRFCEENAIELSSTSWESEESIWNSEPTRPPPESKRRPWTARG